MGDDLPCKTGCENTSNKNITSQKKLIEKLNQILIYSFPFKTLP